MKIAVLTLFLAVQNPSILANVSFSVDGIASRSKESIEYCSSTLAFHGRFHIGSSLNYYDANQHDGDVDFTFQLYGYELRDTSNSSELLGLLSNQQIIFLGTVHVSWNIGAYVWTQHLHR